MPEYLTRGESLTVFLILIAVYGAMIIGLVGDIKALRARVKDLEKAADIE